MNYSLRNKNQYRVSSLIYLQSLSLYHCHLAHELRVLPQGGGVIAYILFKNIRKREINRTVILKVSIIPLSLKK